MHPIVPATERAIEMIEMMNAAVLIPPLKPLLFATIARIRPATARPIPRKGTQSNTAPAIARIKPTKAGVYPSGLGAADAVEPAE